MEHRNPNPPAKPWVVLTMSKVKHDKYHPWHVQGENHYYLPNHPDFHFAWKVPLNDERYDLSRAQLTEG